MIDLTQLLIEKVNEKPKRRVYGRYSASEIWSMLNGYLPVEKFFEPEKKTFEDCMNIWQGVNKHKQVQELLVGSYQCEVKLEREVIVGDQKFLLVGQCDAINMADGLEIKTSMKLHTSAKKWHTYQAKLYCTLFNRPVFKVVQPAFTSKKLFLNVLEEVKRDDEWFNKEMAKLAKYHIKLKEYDNKGIPKTVEQKHSVS